jgi:hypothetical protein
MFLNILTAYMMWLRGITKTAGIIIRPQFCHPGLLRFFISCCLIPNMTRGIKSGNNLLSVDVIMTGL